MATVYVIPNYECNLSCPHCDVKDHHIAYNESAFLSTLTTLAQDKSNSIVLFGGEPTLYKDRFKKCFQYAASVSTNLVIDDSEILDLLLKSKINVATSWNKTRFTLSQEKLWLKNLNLFSAVNKKCMVLITMTPDLIYDQTFQITDVLEAIANTDGVDQILFEHFISDSATEQFQQDCDNWLCQMHDVWRWKNLRNSLEEKVRENKWKFDCSSTQTLLPNGILEKGCPQKTTACICLECLTCKNAVNCQPCSLQRFCTFPKKLYKKLTQES